MKLTKLLERLEYKVVRGSDQIEVTELINDSRKVSEGSVFVCISGAVLRRTFLCGRGGGKRSRRGSG